MTPLTLLGLALTLLAQGGEPDLPLADFEGSDYGAWTVEGAASGRGPAPGTLPDQQPVAGFEGHGLVNTYLGGDAAQGTLTSPAFVIERRYLNFLLGGGDHPGETCVELLVDGVVDGVVVQSSTGADDERLEWESWDVGELRGKSAQLRIADRSSGGWGHVLVDAIAQSDERRAEPLLTAPLYAETWRPQFHFSARTNWINDPNGLVFLDGEYHLFFQHNPAGKQWGNMSWGHAVSPDLVHWTQLEHALLPDRLGTIFSGSAVVDRANTAGFARDGAAPLVVLYTAAGGSSPESQGQPFTQCLAFSTDRGRTFTKYEQNPVLAHVAGENRDPKVVWHAPSARWVMALYLEGETYALFASRDLKSWAKLQELIVPGCGECPDFFELSVEGEPALRKWVFTAANGEYLVGDFDGTRFDCTPFDPAGAPQRVEFGRNCYAVQSWSDVPDGRRIQIGWMNGGRYPHMPFNQQMSAPCELRLARLDGALHLLRTPVRELETLRTSTKSRAELRVSGRVPLEADGALLDVELELDAGDASEVTLHFRDAAVRYSVAEGALECLGCRAPLALEDGRLRLRVLFDRTSIEVFGGDGRVSLSSCWLPRGHAGLELEALGGAARASVRVHELRSAWSAPAR